MVIIIKWKPEYKHMIKGWMWITSAMIACFRLVCIFYKSVGLMKPYNRSKLIEYVRNS